MVSKSKPGGQAIKQASGNVKTPADKHDEGRSPNNVKRYSPQDMMESAQKILFAKEDWDPGKYGPCPVEIQEACRYLKIYLNRAREAAAAKANKGMGMHVGHERK